MTNPQRPPAARDRQRDRQGAWVAAAPALSGPGRMPRRASGSPPCRLGN